LSLANQLLTGFAVCPSGLEALLAKECEAIEGLSEVQAARGGVHFRSDANGMARANLWLRTATRVLLLLDQCRLQKADDILAAARRIPWEQYMGPQQTFRVDVNQGRSPTFQLALPFAGLRVKDGLCDRMREHAGDRPSVDTRSPDIRIWLFIDGEKATLSIDTTGEPLFKRGWRQAKGEAPLRENLAAALIQEANWDGQRPLLDPMCGSGTLIIETVSRWAGLAPGFHPEEPRRFGFENFGSQSPFGHINMSSLRQACARQWQAASEMILPERVVARDLSEALAQTTRRNVDRALPRHLARHIEVSAADFFEATAPAQTGLLITNPPYGKRIDLDQDVRRLSEVLKRHYAGWTAWLLTDDPKFDSALRLKAARRMPVFNGDIECRWMRFDMVSGSARG
jgi:putative N6-adenine-specific DNA methylase